ncbi:hypothetical protein ABBQ38_008490 [Trebouxia sp. C0009 RCD-2024]
MTTLLVTSLHSSEGEDSFVEWEDLLNEGQVQQLQSEILFPNARSERVRNSLRFLDRQNVRAGIHISLLFLIIGLVFLLKFCQVKDVLISCTTRK